MLQPALGLLSRNDLISCGSQCMLYLFDVLLVAGFHFETEVTTVDVGRVAYPFMMHGYDIRSCRSDDFGNMLQLSGFVDQFDGHRIGTTGLLQTAADNPGEDRYIYIATRDQADHFFPLIGTLLNIAAATATAPAPSAISL